MNRPFIAPEVSKSLTATERLALELIWIGKGKNRISLATALGVSKMHATNLSRTLHEKGFINEEPVRTGGRGQPTKRFILNDDAAFAIGVSISKTRIQLGILNSAGEIKNIETRTLKEFSIEEVASLIEQFAQDSAKKKRIAIKKLCGIGISFPADRGKAGRMVQAYFPDWNDMDVEAAFQEKLRYPVAVENDGLCAAWGERLMGAARSIPYFLLINIGYGVGGGIVHEGKILRGCNGNAGVFGVPFPMDAPRPSGQDLIDTLNSEGLNIVDLADLSSTDAVNHKSTQAWLDRASKQLQPALGMLAGAFDPNAIIIGGQVPQHIVDGLIERLDTDEFCATTRGFLPIPAIIGSRLGGQACVTGAASLAYARAFFSDI